jgi:NDP-sugar pyrophosphorylase family protein
MSRRAVILAGGKGTRLHPYTMLLPKPLMPVGEHAILEIIIRQLAKAGFDHVTLAVNHQARILMAYFGDGVGYSMKIDYSLESQPLGTMGPLRLIRDLPDDFLVMNGDILTDLDYTAFYESHMRDGHHMTISAARREQLIDYGVLGLDDNGVLDRFEEKPRIPYLVSMGIYCLNRRILSRIPEGASFGFDNLVLDLLAIGQPAYVAEHGGYWLDIGRPEDYQKATDDWPRLYQELAASGLFNA